MNEAIMREVTDSHWDEILEIRSRMQSKKRLLMVINIPIALLASNVIIQLIL